MEFNDFLQLIGKKRKTIYGVMALFLMLAVAVIAVQRFKYSSSSQLLVVQEYNGAVDAYTASKSSEHLSSVLASVVRSNSFFTKVMATGPSINSAYFGSSPESQIKEWGKTVSAQSINDSGIIAVNVYHPDRLEAEKIAGVVNYVLMTQHSAYDGAGESVKVRLIDQPVTSRIPVKPNIPLIIGSSLIFSFIFSLIYIYLLADNKSQMVYNQAFREQTTTAPPVFREQVTRPQPVFREQAITPQPAYQAPITSRQQQAEPINYQEILERLAAPRVDSNVMATPYGHRATVSLDNRPVHSNVMATPYGHRATVSIDDHPEIFEDPDIVFDPENIIRQGNMRNLID